MAQDIFDQVSTKGDIFDSVGKPTAAPDFLSRHPILRDLYHLPVNMFTGPDIPQTYNGQPIFASPMVPEGITAVGPAVRALPGALKLAKSGEFMQAAKSIGAAVKGSQQAGEAARAPSTADKMERVISQRFYPRGARFEPQAAPEAGPGSIKPPEGYTRRTPPQAKATRPPAARVEPTPAPKVSAEPIKPPEGKLPSGRATPSTEERIRRAMGESQPQPTKAPRKSDPEGFYETHARMDKVFRAADDLFKQGVKAQDLEALSPEQRAQALSKQASEETFKHLLFRLRGLETGKVRPITYTPEPPAAQ